MSTVLGDGLVARAIERCAKVEHVSLGDGAADDTSRRLRCQRTSN